jgi:hypothetical protein
MGLATILGACLLLPGPCGSAARAVHGMAVLLSPQSHENPGSDSSPQNSSHQPATDQQKAPDPSAAPPQPLSTVSPACPENPPPGSTTKPNCKLGQSTGAKPRKRHRPRKAAAPPAPAAEAGPPKTVVRNGGAADPSVDLSPGLSPQQASHQIDSTNQLLATSDANLKKIAGRPLSASQQDTVKQVKSYMEQAKTAADGGDPQRAYHLAVKANLLSTELLGH